MFCFLIPILWLPFRAALFSERWMDLKGIIMQEERSKPQAHPALTADHLHGLTRSSSWVSHQKRILSKGYTHKRAKTCLSLTTAFLKNDCVSWGNWAHKMFCIRGRRLSWTWGVRTKGETGRKELFVSGTFPSDYSQENKAGVVLSPGYHDRNSFTLSKETCGHSVDWKITHCCGAAEKPSG